MGDDYHFIIYYHQNMAVQSTTAVMSMKWGKIKQKITIYCLYKFIKSYMPYQKSTQLNHGFLGIVQLQPWLTMVKQ